jgi:uncharacterized protein (DUF58 family)
MVPTARLWALLLLAALPYAAALADPRLVWVGAGIDGLVLAAFALDVVLTPRARELAVAIRADHVASLGSPFTLRLVVTNAGGASGLSLARVPWPESWAFERGAAVFVLPGRGTAEIPFTATPRRRGRFEIGPAWIRHPSAFGLFQRDARCECRAEVKVYPAVASLKRYQLLVRRLRLREMGLRAQRVRGQGMEFARLREYARGDDPRLIDWKATARRDHLISREYQVERCQNVILMIDAGRMLTEEADGLVKIDHVLHAALLLAQVAAEYDDRVGALVFSDRVERWVAPRKGRAAVTALAEALFDVEPRLVESDYDGAFAHLQAQSRKRALVVLFTNVVDQETSGIVSGYLMAAAGRHVPLCVAVGDRETRSIAERPARTEEEAFVKAAASRLAERRARTLQDLQRRGVHVIDAPAGNIPIAVANRYLDLKARQVL